MLKASNDTLVDVTQPAKSSRRLQWSSYATSYDVVCEHNPAYQENLSLLMTYLDGWDLAADANIADLGAGTGNFLKAMATRLPNANFTHVDSDSTMNSLAKRKYAAAGLEKVDVIEEYLQRVTLPTNHFDLIVCVNVLYAVAPQPLFLSRMHRWLKPGGRLFVIDFGRKIKMLDWGWYLLKYNAHKHGLMHFAKVLASNFEAIKQNKNAKSDFANGVFWEHTTQEFIDVIKTSNFEIEDAFTCYRDYCDLAVCRK
jgi:ubiquinone/menaquinone biosynthesis C-methylase UbiE